jgi:cell division protein FtsW (lipid II flippase)
MDRLRGYFDREGPLRPSTTVVLVSTVLTLLGIIMIGSVSTGPETTAADPYAFTVKQAIFAGVGVLIAFVVSRLPIDLILRGVRPLLLFTWALLVLVLLFGSKQLGATRWIAIGPFHVQPSEIAKVTLILVVAAWASAKAGELSDFRRGFGPGFGAILLTCLLVILEKDMGTTLFLFALGAGCMWAAGAMFRHLVFGSLIAFAAIGVAAGAMGSFDYVVRRLDGYASKSGAAHDQVAAGLDALRSGGVFGTGLGEGSAHLGFVPKIHNDFIVAAIGEQLGLDRRPSAPHRLRVPLPRGVAHRRIGPQPRLVRARLRRFALHRHAGDLRSVRRDGTRASEGHQSSRSSPTEGRRSSCSEAPSAFYWPSPARTKPPPPGPSRTNSG